MSKIIKLTESDLNRIIERAINNDRASDVEHTIKSFAGRNDFPWMVFAGDIKGSENIHVRIFDTEGGRFYKAHEEHHMYKMTKMLFATMVIGSDVAMEFHIPDHIKKPHTHNNLGEALEHVKTTYEGDYAIVPTGGGDGPTFIKQKDEPKTDGGVFDDMF